MGKKLRRSHAGPVEQALTGSREQRAVLQWVYLLTLGWTAGRSCPAQGLPLTPGTQYVPWEHPLHFHFCRPAHLGPWSCPRSPCGTYETGNYPTGKGTHGRRLQSGGRGGGAPSQHLTPEVSGAGCGEGAELHVGPSCTHRPATGSPGALVEQWPGTAAVSLAGSHSLILELNCHTH